MSLGSRTNSTSSALRSCFELLCFELAEQIGLAWVDGHSARGLRLRDRATDPNPDERGNAEIALVDKLAQRLVLNLRDINLYRDLARATGFTRLFVLSLAWHRHAA